MDYDESQYYARWHAYLRGETPPPPKAPEAVSFPVETRQETSAAYKQWQDGQFEGVRSLRHALALDEGAQLVILETLFERRRDG